MRSFKNPNKLYEFVNLMDIDQDGYIDPLDLQYFLKRHSYINHARKKQLEEGVPSVHWNQQ